MVARKSTDNTGTGYDLLSKLFPVERPTVTVTPYNFLRYSSAVNTTSETLSRSWTGTLSEPGPAGGQGPEMTLLTLRQADHVVPVMVAYKVTAVTLRL